MNKSLFKNMTRLLIIGLILFFHGKNPYTVAYSSNGVVHVEKAVKHFNSLENATWTAHHNELGHNFTISSIKSKLGLLPEPSNHGNPNNALLYDVNDLPQSFDCRNAYPKCSTISSIKDQSNCESCWAISVASVMSDRFCIHSNGKINKNLSSNHLLACNKENDGCDGGKMGVAWEFAKNHGTVTGGDYGSFEGCQPYAIKPKGTIEELKSWPEAATPKCFKMRCTNKKYKKKDRLYKISNVTRFPENEYEIRKEIFKNGPVTAGFEVYVSFMFYKSGVFQKAKNDELIGLHAVRLIGWGENEGVKYWIAANSWGRKWGDRGFFKIKRGTHHCGIETMVHSGLPVLPK